MDLKTKVVRKYHPFCGSMFAILNKIELKKSFFIQRKISPYLASFLVCFTRHLSPHSNITEQFQVEVFTSRKLVYCFELVSQVVVNQLQVHAQVQVAWRVE